jgi:hypothetical protein
MSVRIDIKAVAGTRSAGLGPAGRAMLSLVAKAVVPCPGKSMGRPPGAWAPRAALEPNKSPYDQRAVGDRAASPWARPVVLADVFHDALKGTWP